MTEAEILAQFGQARIGPADKTNNWYVEEDKDNVYRILPPMKEQLQTGKWAVYHGKHWGYKIVDRFTGKEVHRQFRCIQQKNKDKSIRVHCAECDLIAEKKQLLERTVNTYKAAGKSDTDIAELVAPINAWLKTHNVDNKYYLNVMNEKGEFGTLAIAITQFGNLEEVIKDLKKRSPQMEAIGAKNGVWFNFRRSGKGRDAKHPVSIVTEEVVRDGETLQKIKQAPLTVEQLTKALAVLPELSDVLRTISAAQIEQLAKSSGDPEQVGAIFNASKEASPAPVQATVAVPVVAAPAVKVEPAVDELADLRRQLAEAKAANAKAQIVTPASEAVVAETAKATAAVITSATAAAAPALSSLSNQDFLSRYGGKK